MNIICKYCEQRLEDKKILQEITMTDGTGMGEQQEDYMMGEIVNIPKNEGTGVVEDGMERELGVKNILDLYQDFTPTTWVEDDDFNANLNHATHGVHAESGEIAGAYQKFYRGDYDEEELRNRLKKEIGGLMYYTAQLCNIEGLRLSDILVQNRDILIDRQNRNVIKGDGDNR